MGNIKVKVAGLKMNRILQMSLLLVSVAALLLISCGTQEPGVPSPGLPKAPSSGTPRAGTPITEVTIEGFAFEPATITVPVGATVTWYNRDSVLHTVTAGDDLFDSSRLPTNGTFTYTFAQAGTFEYYCAIHPSMEGKIVVE